MKQQFLTAYEAELVKRYGWAADAAKLAKYMASVSATIDGTASSWNCDPTAEAQKAAWAAIGGKGKATLKALRGLS